MNQSNTDKIIKILNTTLSENFHDFEGAYFYGSRVRGDHSFDSDIDIVALFKKEVDRDRRMEIWGLIGDIEAEYDVFIDLHPMTRKELENNPVYYDQVVNKGIFYEAA